MVPGRMRCFFPPKDLNSAVMPACPAPAPADPSQPSTPDPGGRRPLQNEKCLFPGSLLWSALQSAEGPSRSSLVSGRQNFPQPQGTSPNTQLRLTFVCIQTSIGGGGGKVRFPGHRSASLSLFPPEDKNLYVGLLWRVARKMNKNVLEKS